MKRLGKTFVVTEDNALEYADRIAAWIREKLNAAGREGVVLGVSGGIDSTLVGALCGSASIPVYAALMPCGQDMRRSRTLSRALEVVERYDFLYEIFDIQAAYDLLNIAPEGLNLNGERDQLAQMNIGPRLRMARLYYLAQQFGYAVIGTDNLAENVVGYFTKWGDGANDLQPLSMLTKREVYVLARALGVPQSVIEAAPTAGLYDGQTDEEELGITYDQIDDWILDGTSGDVTVDEKIEARYRMGAHKRDPIPVFVD